MEAAHPILIYLHQRDVGKAIRRVFDLRGERWSQWQVDWKVHNRPYGKKRGLRGVDGFVTLYSAHRQLTDKLFADSHFQKLAVETSTGDWDRYLLEILSFLGSTMEKPLR